MKSRKGFTLAEILVTLVIIGTVAALTIPALIQDTQKADLKTALKKSVATLNQALVMSVAQDSTDTTTCDDCETANATALMNFFTAKLNVISQNTSTLTPSFVTADGISYTFIDKDAGVCNTSSGSNDPVSGNCVVRVDVNGASKGQNTYATTGEFRDQYNLIIKQASVVPATNAGNTAAVDALQQ